jgi:hypothetical protein
MSQFLRIFPGDEKKGFREVSEKAWDESILQADKHGWGNVCNMTAEVKVYSKVGGNLLIAKKWPSKSYTRNFARIVRMMFVATNLDLTNEFAATFDTQMVTANATDGGLIPKPDFVLNQEGGATGAGMAIGRGVANEDHTRSELVDLVARERARGSVFTVTDDATTFSFSIVAGFEITAPAGETITEIGLLSYIRDKDDTVSTNPTAGRRVLIAYDGATSTPVSQGGVIAPKYTLEFPV